MDNLYKFYQEFCLKPVQAGQYIPEYYKWRQYYKTVPKQLQTPSIKQEKFNNATDSDKPIKFKKKNEHTASNKRPRESCDYTQAAKLVKLWKKNVHLIKPSR